MLADGARKGDRGGWDGASGFSSTLTEERLVGQASERPRAGKGARDGRVGTASPRRGGGAGPGGRGLTGEGRHREEGRRWPEAAQELEA